MLSLTSHESVSAIGREVWESLLAADAPPFLRFDWLEALETTGCVGEETGWLPMHLTLKDGERLIAAAPAYLKGHSQGEFVFDHGWANFAEQRLGLPYYPKLIVAVPFTPATGPRLLIHPEADPDDARNAFAAGLVQLVDRLSLSSCHVLFPTRVEAEHWEGLGFARRSGMQFHWHNRGYQSFDDFLQDFSSKRRAAIRRERRELVQAGVELSVLTGSELDSTAVDHIFEFYSDTVHKYYWGRQYLNRAFFETIAATMSESLHVVFARPVGGGAPVGGAFNLLGKRALYGRYWGARQDLPFLHFNVCYYAGVEDCIRRGLDLFEPGAGGEHKHSRGFEPTVTESVHFLADPRLDGAVRQFVEDEAQAIAQHVRNCPAVLRSR